MGRELQGLPGRLLCLAEVPLSTATWEKALNVGDIRGQSLLSTALIRTRQTQHITAGLSVVPDVIEKEKTKIEPPCPHVLGEVRG